MLLILNAQAKRDLNDVETAVVGAFSGKYIFLLNIVIFYF